MAEDRIQYSDFVDSKGILKDWEADLKRMEKAVGSTFARIKKDAGGLFKDTGDTKQMQQDIDKLKQMINELSAAKKAEKTVNEQLEKAQQRLTVAQRDEAQTLAKVREETRQVTRERNLQAKADVAAKGSIQALKAETNRLNAELEKLNLKTKQGRQQAAEYQKQIRRNNDELKKLDATIGRHQRNVGNYSSDLKNLGRQLLGAAGVVGGVMLFTNTVKRAIRVTKEFDSALASLSAITGLTGDELAYFGEQSVKISKRTLQSANDVLKAFERVGSIRPELLKAKESLAGVTEAAIILSESTGGLLSMEQAADAAAGAMNQFNIDSKESVRVVNALAAGSKFGSATTVQLSESFKMFGAVANAANISLEESIALVELAASKMLVGSEAGTAIRASILRLQQAQLGYQSGTFNMADAIDEANIKLAGMETQMERDEFMLDTFGQRNILFGNILLSNKEKYVELTEAVTGTNTALEQQATNLETLSGSMTKMSNTWDLVITGSEKSKDGLKGVYDVLNQILTGVLNLREGASEEEGSMLGRIFSTSATYSDRLRRSLALTYPILGAVLSLYDEGGKKVDDANDAFDYNAWITGKVSQNVDENTKTIWENIEAFIKARDAVVDLNEEQDEGDQTTKDYGNSIAGLHKELKQAQESRAAMNRDDLAGIAIQNDIIAGLERQIKLLGELQASQPGFIGPQPETPRAPQAQPDAGGLPTQLAYRQADEEIAAVRYSEDEKLEIREAGVDALYDLYDGFFSFMQGRRQREINEVETQRQYELSLHADNVEAQEQINDKYDKKLRELRRKQARNEKTKALFDIAINTAVGIAKSIPNPWLIAFSAIIGAVQAAIVASKPLPAYKHGVKSKPESGWAIVNEEGQEMIIHPSGHVELTSGGEHPEMRYLEKDTEVLTAEETRRRLSFASDRRLRPYNDKLSTARMESLQEQQVRQQRETNELLGKYKYFDGKKLRDLRGNTQTYV